MCETTQTRNQSIRYAGRFALFVFHVAYGHADLDFFASMDDDTIAHPEVPTRTTTRTGAATFFHVSWSMLSFETCHAAGLVRGQACE